MGQGFQGRVGGQVGAGRAFGGGGAVVGVGGGGTEVQRGGHGVGGAGAVQQGVQPVAFGPAQLQVVRAAARLGVAALERGALALRVRRPPGGLVRGFGAAQRRRRDVPAFARARAGEGGPLQDAVGQAGFPGGGLRERVRVQFGGAARGLGHAVGEREEPFVAADDALLGGPPQLGEALLDGGEAAGVEELAQQLGARRFVRAQEAGEVALRQQHHLAELIPAHAQQLLDLGADLLVRAAERLPGAGVGVVDAQQALCLLLRHPGAALLGPGLFGPPGDLQAPFADGEFEDDLGRGQRVGVVAAQGESAALPGAGHLPVQAVADGVEDGRLARAGRPVQQEEPGGRQLVEVDVLGGAEGAEGGDGQPVEPHRGSSPSVLTASRASPSSTDSPASGPRPPRTWATKSSAISRSVRPRSRCA